MALGDLFKSKSERDRDKAKKRREGFRNAERNLGTLSDRITKLKKERDGAWGKARQYLKDGQKAASQRELQTYRASEVMLRKLETKRWVFEQLVGKLEIAKTDEEFAGALKAMDMAVNIDPDQIEDVLADVGIKLEDQEDTEKIWDKEFSREMEGVEGQADTLPSVEEMESQLQDEVAAEVREKRPSRKESAKDSTEKEEKEEPAGDIGEARERLRKLMEGK